MNYTADTKKIKIILTENMREEKLLGKRSKIEQTKNKSNNLEIIPESERIDKENKKIILIGKLPTNCSRINICLKDTAALNPSNPLVLLRGVDLIHVSSKLFNFPLIYSLLENVYLQEKFPIEHLKFLTKIQIEFVELFFECLYQKPINLEIDFKNIGTATELKKPFENTKFVYSRFKRIMLETFSEEFNSLKEKENCKNNEIFRDIKTGVNYFIFHEHFKKNVDTVDFMMDVFMGIPLGNYKENKLKKEKNWRAKKKGKLSNWTSPMYKYYIGSSHFSKKLFFDFLTKEIDKNGKTYFWRMIEKETKENLYKKLKEFEELFYKYNGDVPSLKQLFIEKGMYRQLKKGKEKVGFKMPWLIADIKRAALFCMDELKDSKIKKWHLEKEYLKKKHYSYTR